MRPAVCAQLWPWVGGAFIATATVGSAYLHQAPPFGGRPKSGLAAMLGLGQWGAGALAATWAARAGELGMVWGMSAPEACVGAGVIFWGLDLAIYIGVGLPTLYLLSALPLSDVSEPSVHGAKHEEHLTD